MQERDPSAAQCGPTLVEIPVDLGKFCPTDPTGIDRVWTSLKAECHLIGVRNRNTSAARDHIDVIVILVAKEKRKHAMRALYKMIDRDDTSPVAILVLNFDPS